MSSSVPLGQLIRPAKSERLGKQRLLPILSMTMRNGLVDQTQKFKKQVASLDLSPYKVAGHGQLVVGFPIDEAVLAVQRLYPQGIVSPAYAIWDVETSKVDDRYLELFLRSSRAIDYYKSKLRGSTARRRSLPKADFLAMPVPLVDLEEQRRLASLLDSAQGIRDSRIRSLELTGELVTSLFDQFNTEQVPRTRLGNAVSFSSGRFLPAKAMVSAGSVAVYGGNGINGRHDTAMFDEPKIVVGRVGANCGAVHITEELSWVTDNAMVVNWRQEDFETSYLAAALVDADLNQYASQSGQPLISAARIADVLLPSPARDVQEEYGRRLASLESLRAQQEAHLALLDELFASLQHRAFTGQL